MNYNATCVQLLFRSALIRQYLQDHRSQTYLLCVKIASTTRVSRIYIDVITDGRRVKQIAPCSKRAPLQQQKYVRHCALCSHKQDDGVGAPARSAEKVFTAIAYAQIMNYHQNIFVHQDVAAAVMYAARVAGEGRRSSACSSKLSVDVDMLHFGQLTRLFSTS